MQRLRARYIGRVQGVGFRMTVAELAGNFRVTGNVRNVDDGSVEVTAEGESGELVEFQRSILERMERNIVDHQEEWQDIDEPSHPGFSIAPDKQSPPPATRGD